MPDSAAEQLKKLTRDLGEGSEKFETFLQFLAVDGGAGYSRVVANHPAQLVFFAIGPQQLADLPYVVTASAMRACAEIAPAMQREGNDVGGTGCHGPLIAKQRRADCDATLTMGQLLRPPGQF
jgi:hypothetical protein